jgi:hypothetical protein
MRCPSTPCATLDGFQSWPRGVRKTVKMWLWNLRGTGDNEGCLTLPTTSLSYGSFCYLEIEI